MEQEAEVSAREAIELWRANSGAWLHLCDVLVDAVRANPKNRRPWFADTDRTVANTVVVDCVTTTELDCRTTQRWSRGESFSLIFLAGWRINRKYNSRKVVEKSLTPPCFFRH